jgi:hypothetical protein
MIDAETARQKYRDLIRQAADDGLDECRRLLAEKVDNCDHDHVVTTGRDFGEVAFCEDCGQDWDSHDFEYATDEGDLTVVGSV